VLDGGAGDDVLSARDGARDTIRCGAGRDTVTADRLDTVARDCERVSRH
jgi:Ca2+-binding RTX toxin-like protein